MSGDARSDEDRPVPIADAIENLYRVFAGYRLEPHVEGCPHCVSAADHARIYSRPLRSLTADDLDRYAYKAMTTWGGVQDFRHFLPRLLELTVSGDPDWSVDTELILGKLAYADWSTWPDTEQTALRSLLRLRWSIGLSQDAADILERDSSRFDADAWLCGVARAGDDTAPYIEAWRTEGATKTIEHVAAFLAANPDLLTRGKLGNGYWPGDPQMAVCAEQMRSWLTACMEDPDFQAQLANHYRSRSGDIP